MHHRLGALVVAALLVGACAPQGGNADAGTTDFALLRTQQLEALQRWEREERARMDWRNAPPAQSALGSDPIAIQRVAPSRFVVLLRGEDAAVLMDDDGVERSRVAAPRAPRALALAPDGSVLVVGELSGVVMRLRVQGDALILAGQLAVPDRVGFTGVSCSSGEHGERIHVVDGLRGQLLTLDAQKGVRLTSTVDVGAGALSVRTAGPHIVVNAIEGHALWMAPLDGVGVPDAARALVLRSDGPVWGFDARWDGQELWVAWGLAEDHALDRTHGSFEFIDSFLRVARVGWKGGAAQVVRTADVNLSERGVVLPKAVQFAADGTLWVAGCGSGRLLHLDPAGSSIGEARAVPPGCAAMAARDGDGAGFWVVNPLLDAVVKVEALGSQTVQLGGSPRRDVLSRVGEALVFTTVLGPKQKSDGGLSRFTCEVCHFEGGGDGRIHATGRGDVHATAKPLLGLGNNIPLFTRALDANLIEMAHNEVRVANAGSDLDPWFSIRLDDAPWLASLGVTQTLSPADVRHALASFFFSFRPKTNARTVGRHAFTPLERQGAALFEQRCASCHAARLIGNDPQSAVPAADWEALIFSDAGPLVWAREGYEKTGIEPYVNEQGARPSSLRRIERKHPYFTNGAAASLRDVLHMARFDEQRFLHASSDGALSAFNDDETDALLAFLILL